LKRRPEKRAQAPAEAARAHAARAGLPAEEPPIWAGRPDPPAFATLAVERLARATRALDRMRAVTGRRTPANTLAPYDEALIELDGLGSQASLMENVHPDAAMRAAAEKVTQQTSAFATDLSLDRQVYDALVAMDLSGADDATRFYVERTLREFRLSGVDRDAATRARIKRLSEELVEISQEFSRNIRSDLRTIPAADASELEGLPEDFIARHPPGPDGRITLTIDYPDSTPVFLYAKRDDLRRRMYLEYSNRAFPANVAVLDRMIARRHELATLLDFASWADYVTANKMVENGATAAQFIDRIVEVSTERAAADYTMLLARKRQDDAAAQGLTAWETSFYSERVRQSSYDFDAQKLRPYFPFARVRQGVLDMTGRLFGVTYERVPDAPVWHPSVECWEVFEHGRCVGRFYLDMHPRPDKYNHAAQFDVRTGVAGRQIPVAALICNFPGGEPGDPGLMEHSDVRTLFHEFGHLLHNLFAGRQRWVGIGGIRTEQDFVEVPSQLLEEWTWDPATLATFARHHQSGEPIPAELVQQMKRASDFGKGLMMRRQMVYARTSLSAYDRPPAEVDLDRIIRDLTVRYQPFAFVEGTHMQCAFGHLDGYSAVYYTYMWSLVIAKDFFGRFDTANLMAPEVALRYRHAVLEPGGSKPAAKLVEDFLGRPFSFEAFRAWLNEGG